MTPKPANGGLGTAFRRYASDYRAFVGPAEKYDLLSAMQFNLLTFLGLREHHFLLDIGCGSLRAGRLFIPYLLPGRYFGIEPEQWLIDEGINNELGEEMLRLKRPVFSNEAHFTLSAFDRKFDFVLAQSVLSHASQAQIERCLSEARKVMLPTSVFAATFMKGETNYAGEEWVYPGCVYYTLEHLTNLVERQGLVCKPLGWPHLNEQTWIVIVHPEGLVRLPGPLWDPEASSELFNLFRNIFADRIVLPWMERRQMAIQEITALIPPEEAFILVDEGQWATGDTVAGRRRFLFLEREGEYWGRPPDDATAIREFERLRLLGASFIAFGWPAFWWLDYYSGLHRHLRSEFSCVLENDRLVIFDLRP
jgi:SAM-dependent methyltransferase